jgi:hypothetical protein
MGRTTTTRCWWGWTGRTRRTIWPESRSPAAGLLDQACLEHQPSASGGCLSLRNSALTFSNTARESWLSPSEDLTWSLRNEAPFTIAARFTTTSHPPGDLNRYRQLPGPLVLLTRDIPSSPNERSTDLDNSDISCSNSISVPIEVPRLLGKLGEAGGASSTTASVTSDSCWHPSRATQRKRKFDTFRDA